MGCDIHVHTEVKVNGKWEHYSTVSPDRRYDLFAIMANVRNYSELEPIAEPRGIPEDATAMTVFVRDYDGVDGHSHSWLNAEEIAVAIDRYERLAETNHWKLDPEWEGKDFGWLFGNGWSDWTKYPEDRPEGVEDIRWIFWWIFWFDN